MAKEGKFITLQVEIAGFWAHTLAARIHLMVAFNLFDYGALVHRGIASLQEEEG